MSGSIYDRYPSGFYKLKIFDNKIVYLGGKVNHNMVSDIAPFRRLSYFLVERVSRGYPITFASVALDLLGYECQIQLIFQIRGAYDQNGLGLGHSHVELMLDDSSGEASRARDYLEHLYDGTIRLADIRFFRKGRAFRLSELSSGEKHYILAILGFMCCGEKRCVLLYDEPENSLHPEWQLSIVKDLTWIAEHIHTNSTILIATHSPLIASSVQNAKAYVCDLPEGQAWHRSNLYGRGSDAVLHNQFHLYSSRSPEVVAIVNRCLTLIAENKTNEQQFKKAQSTLREHNLELTKDDPLYRMINTILQF